MIVKKMLSATPIGPNDVVPKALQVIKIIEQTTNDLKREIDILGEEEDWEEFEEVLEDAIQDMFDDIDDAMLFSDS